MQSIEPKHVLLCNVRDLCLLSLQDLTDADISVDSRSINNKSIAHIAHRSSGHFNHFHFLSSPFSQKFYSSFENAKYNEYEDPHKHGMGETEHAGIESIYDEEEDDVEGLMVLSCCRMTFSPSYQE